MKKEPLADRFWRKVRLDDPDKCWLWCAMRLRQGGHGRIGNGGRLLLAHRVSWELHFGPIPDGLEVCHSCDNPPCCNPAHLFLGTHLDNMKDMAAKGRHVSVNAQKTECVRGHPFTPENTYFWRGKRRCRTCQHDRSVANWARTKKGVGYGANMRARTHCPWGHEYNAENTMRFPSSPTFRRCRICCNARCRAWYARQKAS